MPCLAASVETVGVATLVMRWLPPESPALKVGAVLKVFTPLKVFVPFCVASVEGRRAALMVEEPALIAVTMLLPAEVLTSLAVVAVVAVKALPLSTAVIVPAAKFPSESRLTMVFGRALLAALFAAVTPDATFAALVPPTVATVVVPCVPVTSPDNDPEKFAALVAVAALPLRSAVMVPAEKLPSTSRLTIVLTVLLLVAELTAVTPLATLLALMPPTVETVVAD
jgi:hypothetical protein